MLAPANSYAGWNPNESDDLEQAAALAAIPRTHSMYVASASAAADYEVGVYKAPAQGAGAAVTRVSFVVDTAITGAATNTATITVRQYRAGTLVGAVSGVTAFVTTASLAVLTEQVLFSGQLNLRTGDVLTVQTTHAGTGAALPALRVFVEAAPLV